MTVQPAHCLVEGRCASVSAHVQDAESATHVIIGDKHEALHALNLPEKAHVVSSEWLESCLSKQKHLPERDYAADLDELAREASSKLSLPAALLMSHAMCA